MSSFKILQQAFTTECNATQSIPKMEIWSQKIREIFNKEAVYVIIHKYVDVSGSEIDAFIVRSNEINWQTKKNDPDFRSKYFHKSKFDSNIWILIDKYRTETQIIKSLLVTNNFI
ncbi:hypothetical protein QLL95_gp0501 [Cotonvirus japonicus]|uniref:Uncharacterized protein n=1 Tax=Cotonvirus japonicus TaxID=2811091 RepID=A0ABM7NTW9_9VIRU|nr:hypothetical protein QLL95_gp0501 [Cotonvirus japonicus]BCS83622.1 hypothetical protein [Cotonvirus japonicus]